MANSDSRFITKITVAVFGLNLFMPVSVFANDQESSGLLEEIVVTANKRSESLQDVAISVTAVTGTVLESAHVLEPYDLPGVAPGLAVDAPYGTTAVRFSLRGIGTEDYTPDSTNGVGTYVDEVFMGNLYGLGFGIFDIERVEVIRGPQGTLWGKNTTAGAVSFITHKPKKNTAGYLTATYGRFDEVRLDGAQNIVISENASARIAGQWETRDGYIRETNLGQLQEDKDKWTARAQLNWEPSDNLNVLFNIHGGQNRGDPDIHKYYDITGTFLIPSTGGVDTVQSTVDDTRNEVDAIGGYIRIDWDMAGGTLTSISGYEHLEGDIRMDDEGGLIDYFSSKVLYDVDQFTQEIRFASAADKNTRWILGGFFLYENNKTDLRFIAVDPVTLALIGFYPYQQLIDTDQDTTEYSIFGNVEHDLTDRVNIHAGGRVNFAEKEILYQGFNFAFGFPFELNKDNFRDVGINGPGTIFGPLFADEERNWTLFSWDVGINFKLTDDALVYFDVSRGTREGRFNTASTTQDGFGSVDPEENLAFEVGLKSEFFDNRLRLNTALYSYNLSNYQQRAALTSTFEGIFLLNVGDVDVKGFEVEADAVPVDGLTLSFGVAYADAEIKDDVYTDNPYLGTVVNAKGNRPGKVPDWTATFAASYRFVTEIGQFGIKVDGNYRNAAFNRFVNMPPNRNSPRTIANARLTYTPAQMNNLKISGWVRNFTDERPVVNAFFLAGGVSRSFGPPRTYGVTASYNWD